MADRPLPVPTPTSQPFWDGLRQHRLLLQHSPSTGQWVYYPRNLAPGTLADDLEWREAAGAGVVYTFTIARRPTAPAWEGASPQLIAVVELDEGPKVTTELVGIAPEAVRIGLRVRAVFEDVPGRAVTLLRFAPAG